MRSSFYIQIVLYIVCILFIFSFFTFLTNLKIHFNLFQSKQTVLIHNYYSIQATFPQIKHAKTYFTDDLSLRQKILGTNSKKHSIFNRFTYLNPPKLSCRNLQNPNNSMIIIVLSHALNLDYRQAIRATWGRKGKYKSNNIFVQTIFFVGIDDSLQSAIRNEQSLFNDVIEINIPENLAFMAHKELAALFWLRLYCPLARILFRIDDDIVLDIFLLLNHIEHKIDLNHRDGIYGWFRFNKNVLRSGRWAVTKREYKEDVYPPYTLSSGYLFTNNSCQRLVETANHPKHHINRINDAYITGILRQLAQIQFYTYSNLTHFSVYPDGQSCNEEFAQQPRLLVCTSKLHIGTRGDPDEFYDIWGGLLYKHNTSLLTF